MPKERGSRGGWGLSPLYQLKIERIFGRFSLEFLRLLGRFQIVEQYQGFPQVCTCSTDLCNSVPRQVHHHLSIHFLMARVIILILIMMARLLMASITGPPAHPQSIFSSSSLSASQSTLSPTSSSHFSPTVHTSN